ncbi:MAG: hypothetical protein LBB87_04675 [Nitrososphaerota archaeon]|nr:hypothetical protein [Nitrososphaerota archaeon]
MPSSRQNFGVAVVDDILYAIGGASIRGTPLALNEQYIPIGYFDAIQHSTVNPTPSDSFNSPTSEPKPTAAASMSILAKTAIAITILIICIITPLFFYITRKRKTTVVAT